MQLQVTQKLLAKLPVNAQGQLAATARSQHLFDAPSLQINPLSGWHGKLMLIQRRNCVLLVHDATRFPLFIPALTKPDFAELNDCFVDALLNALLKIGADEAQLDSAQHCLRPLQIDTQCNRSVQGTLNQMGQAVEHVLWYDNLNVAEMTGTAMSVWLADMPYNVKGGGTVWPIQAMLALLSGLAATRRQQYADKQ
jgi:hypothetical protein